MGSELVRLGEIHTTNFPVAPCGGPQPGGKDYETFLDAADRLPDVGRLQRCRGSWSTSLSRPRILRTSRRLSRSPRRLRPPRGLSSSRLSMPVQLSMPVLSSITTPWSTVTAMDTEVSAGPTTVPVSRSELGSVSEQPRASFIREKTKDFSRCDPLSSVESEQFDDEGAAGNHGTALLDQATACLHRPTGGQQVVDHQDALIFFNAVDVHFQRIGAVFQVVFEGVRVVGQFARFTDRNESHIQFQRQGRGKNESARFSRCHDINLFVAIVVGQLTDRFRQRIGRRPAAA